MKKCIFCEIIKGNEAANIIYETDDVICILPTKMEVYGHSLVISKRHFADLYAIPPDILTELTLTIQKLTKAYKKSIQANGMNILHASGKSAQQSVLHFHFHLFPRFNDDGLNTWPKLPAVKTDSEVLLEKIKIN